MAKRAATNPRRLRRSFTLIEVMVAGVITALVLGSVSSSLAQLGRVKNSCKRRFDAHLRADAALNALRRDLIAVVRSDDLFLTRVLLYDDAVATPLGDMHRDEILVFNTRLRPVRDIDNFNGEGIEYESQFRIAEDDFGPVLWQRRDALPDEYLLGGGVAPPRGDGILGLFIEAYDGDEWFDEWDSDYDGLPVALRLTVTASGHRDAEDLYSPSTPIAILRTVVPIDRVPLPRDVFEAEWEETEELEQQLLAEEQAARGGEATTGPGTGGETAPPGGDGNLGGTGSGRGGKVDPSDNRGGLQSGSDTNPSNQGLGNTANEREDTG